MSFRKFSGNLSSNGRFLIPVQQEDINSSIQAALEPVYASISSSSSALSSSYDAVVGSASEVTAKKATHSSIAAAISSVSSGGQILILQGEYSESLTITKPISLIGKGINSIINGSLTLQSEASYSILEKVRIKGNVVLNGNGNSLNHLFLDAAASSVLTDNGINNKKTNVVDYDFTAPVLLNNLSVSYAGTTVRFTPNFQSIYSDLPVGTQISVAFEFNEPVYSVSRPVGASLVRFSAGSKWSASTTLSTTKTGQITLSLLSPLTIGENVEIELLADSFMDQYGNKAQPTTFKSFSIIERPIPITNLTYSQGLTFSYTPNVAITPNTPSYSGSQITSWSVAPALPAGLTLNTSTGIISGTPTVLSSASNYTITATNIAGSVTKVISIAVTDALTFSLTKRDTFDNLSNIAVAFFEFTFSSPVKLPDPSFYTYLPHVLNNVKEAGVIIPTIVGGQNFNENLVRVHAAHIGHNLTLDDYYNGNPTFYNGTTYNTKYTVYIEHDGFGSDNNTLNVNLTFPQGFGVTADNKLSNSITVNNVEVLSNNWY